MQDRLLALTPGGTTGQTLGLHSCGLLAMQGVGAALAGAVAQWTSPGMAMAVMAVASTAVTLVLAPGLRGEPTPLPATNGRPAAGAAQEAAPRAAPEGGAGGPGTAAGRRAGGAEGTGAGGGHAAAGS